MCDTYLIQRSVFIHSLLPLAHLAAPSTREDPTRCSRCSSPLFISMRDDAGQRDPDMIRGNVDPVESNRVFLNVSLALAENDISRFLPPVGSRSARKSHESDSLHELENR